MEGVCRTKGCHWPRSVGEETEVQSGEGTHLRWHRAEFRQRWLDCTAHAVSTTCCPPNPLHLWTLYPKQGTDRGWGSPGPSPPQPDANPGPASGRRASEAWPSPPHGLRALPQDCQPSRCHVLGSLPLCLLRTSSELFLLTTLPSPFIPVCVCGLWGTRASSQTW